MRHIPFLVYAPYTFFGIPTRLHLLPALNIFNAQAVNMTKQTSLPSVR
jgi:hypothetical protein